MRHKASITEKGTTENPAGDPVVVIDKPNTKPSDRTRDSFLSDLTKATRRITEDHGESHSEE